jgi:hypothetical protein
VSELDITRLFAAPDYDLVVAELREGELRAATDAYQTTADPRNLAADGIWWNWCRMPGGTSQPHADPATVAVIPGVAERLREWLGRDVTVQRTAVSAAQALTAAIDR